MKFILFIIANLLSLAAFAYEFNDRSLVTCELKSSSGMQVDISVVQSDGKYQILEGSNFDHPLNIIDIDKPIFLKKDGKCTYSYKSMGKTITIDYVKNELSVPARILGLCKFTISIDTCETSPSQNSKINSTSNSSQSSSGSQ